MNRRDFVQQLLDGRPCQPVADTAEAFAPSNIALCKYWGKRDPELNLPRTSSLSVSLGHLGTTTELAVAERDQIILNDQLVSPDQPFAKRLIAYLDLFRRPGLSLRVATRNSVPTAAGVASSASGFAALVLAMDQLFGWQLQRKQLSMLARVGSGSAARSVFDGFVLWHRGDSDDGDDSFAEQLPNQWPQLRVGLNLVTDGPKGISSTDAMNRTVADSPLYHGWPNQVAADIAQVQQAINDHDFERLGTVAERNALAMHGTMLGANPPILYWQPQTVAAFHRVWDLRAQGVSIYLTIDAGPNVKLLFPASERHSVRAAFPDLTVTTPFASS